MRLSEEQRALAAASQGIAYAVVERFNIRWGALKNDAVAEAMVALCLAASTYDGEKARFSTWAWAKIHWRLVDWVAARRHQKLEPLGDEALGVPALERTDEAASDLQVARMVSEALGDARVPADVAEVVELACRGLTKAQIALELGVSVSTVARRRKAARELLAPLRKQIIAESEK